MTDPKPATPATDEQVKAWIELGADGRLFIPAHVIDSLVARISADAETIKAKDEEIERLKAQVQVGHDVIRDFDSRIDTARAQVETLSGALEIARKIIYTKTWDTDQHALDAMAAALAATEPKG